MDEATIEILVDLYLSTELRIRDTLSDSLGVSRIETMMLVAGMGMPQSVTRIRPFSSLASQEVRVLISMQEATVNSFHWLEAEHVVQSPGRIRIRIPLSSTSPHHSKIEAVK